MISLVPVNMVDQVWPQVADGFQRASDRFGGDLTVGDMWMACRAGHAFLFVVHDETSVKAATVWKHELWRSGQKFRCMALYGEDMGEWFDDLRTLVRKVGRDGGATSAVSEGREGWRKKLPNAKVLRILLEEPI